MAGGGDIEVLFTADDRDVSEGMDRLKRKAGGMAAEWAKANDKVKEQFTGFKNFGPAAMGAVTAAYGMAIRAAMDYRDKNSYINAQMEDLETASRRVWTNIGRDISAGGVAWLTDTVNLIEDVRVGLVDTLSPAFRELGDLMTGQAIGNGVVDDMIVGDAMRAHELMDKEAKDRLAVEKEIFRLSIDTERVKGGGDSAKRMEIELQRKDALRNLDAMNLSGGSDKENLRSMIEERAKWALHMVQLEADQREQKDREEMNRAEELARKKEETARREQDALSIARQRAELDVQAVEAESRRGKETKKVVDSELEEIDLARKILDVRQNEALTSVQKLDLINRLQDVSAATVKGILSGSSGMRPDFYGVQSGVNSSAAVTRSANGGPTMNIAVQTRDAAQRTARAVEKIAERGLTAVFA